MMSPNRFGFLAAAIALGCIAAGAWAGNLSRSHTRTTQSTVIRDEPESMPGKRLEIDLKTGGGLRIEGRDGNVVSVEYANNQDTCPDADVTVDRFDGGVRVTSRYLRGGRSHSCSMHLVIRVPKRYDLQIRSAGGGIEITDVRGTIEGSTGGGELELARLGGTVSLRTGGGSIHVVDSQAQGSVATGGGRVLLENVSSDLEATSGSGPIVRRGRSKTL